MSTATLPILESAVLVVAAPLCGVALATRRCRGGWLAAMLFAITLAISAVLTIASRAWVAEAVRTTLISHATLAVTGFALAALGAWLGSALRDPLDAAALSTGAAIAAALGLLALGPLGADLPTTIVNAALAASPIVANASAANVDVLRTDLLYRISPLAHRRFDYPTWYAALALYGAVLLISVAGTARSLRKGWL